MKKFLILLSILSVSIFSVSAKDYVKTQIKEMKHAQKYATTKNVLQNTTENFSYNSVVAANIKDPHIMQFGDYKKIPKEEYNKKLKKDEVKYEEYAVQLGRKHSKYYTTQADAEDFYKVYRVAERIIRANKLDYMNWRICLKKSVDNVNASSQANLITITTSLFDNFNNNDDALAMIIGHEMGHSLLGHYKRTNQLYTRMKKEQALAKAGNSVAAVAFLGMKRKFLIDSKNMEYAADIEGAKLALKAGYNLNSSSDVLSFLTQYDLDRDFASDHPNSDKRLESLKENTKLFPTEEWKEMGEYNIYNSEVLPVQLSSDRKSIVISVPQNKLEQNKYYNPESMSELYARLGYMSYKNGQFSKSLEYFGELFKIDKNNASAYLYASYAGEYLYKNTGDNKYLNLAKDYARKAYSLDSANKYFKEQVESL